MKRSVVFMILVLFFGVAFAANNNAMPNYVDPNDNNGYYFEDENGSSGNVNANFDNVIIYNYLDGTSTSYDDGTMDITITLWRIPQRTTYYEVYRKINDGAWEKVYESSTLYYEPKAGDYVNRWHDYVTEAVSGDSLSYYVVFYSGWAKNKFLGVSNTVTFVYQ